jgi:hypothetical protein
MKKAIILSGLLLAVSASLAAAQGINLRLNDCAAAGTTNAAASCATNAGIAISMVGSAIVPSGMDRVVACEGYIDVQTSAASLSPWWLLESTGCRPAALTFSFDFTTAPGTCNDFWAGGATGGGGVSPDHSAPNRLQIKLVGATPGENPIDSGAEQYMFKANINRTKSTGAGSCAGCLDAACFVLNRLVVNQPAGVGDATISTPMLANYVTYAGGVIGGLGCPAATPTQNRTWGQVKGMYR